MFLLLLRYILLFNLLRQYRWHGLLMVCLVCHGYHNKHATAVQTVENCHHGSYNRVVSFANVWFRWTSCSLTNLMESLTELIPSFLSWVQATAARSVSLSWIWWRWLSSQGNGACSVMRPLRAEGSCSLNVPFRAVLSCLLTCWWRYDHRMCYTDLCERHNDTLANDSTCLQTCHLPNLLMTIVL